MLSDRAKISQPSTRYTKIARALHWLIAIAIMTLLLLGQRTMSNHEIHLLPTIHASAGLVIFCYLLSDYFGDGNMNHLLRRFIRIGKC